MTTTPDAGRSAPMLTPTALIVLGGGGGRRLGGVSKPDLLLGGRRLLDRVLDAGADFAPRVVVAPESVEVPDGVLRTLEDPPAGGPVAGIAAGLALLRTLEHDPVDERAHPTREHALLDVQERQADDRGGDVLIAACDLPGAAGFVGPLRAARDAQRATGSSIWSSTSPISSSSPASPSAPDGVIAAHSDGGRELLAVLADRAALEASIREGGAQDRSVRSLLAPLELSPVTVPEASMEDVDTWEQHAAWERRTQ